MTMYLKQICNLLSKKPQAMDVMLQFTSPARIVRPLCQFLDDWHYDSDQGEFFVKRREEASADQQRRVSTGV
jgi:mediator of RNA polymerase II transcription subunit 5